MNKVSELKQVFRAINEGLTKIKLSEGTESERIVQSLKVINEEMCDQVVDLLKAYNKIKEKTNESTKNI